MPIFKLKSINFIVVTNNKIYILLMPIYNILKIGIIPQMPDNQSHKIEPLQEKELMKTASRRDFFRSLLWAGAFGGGAYYGSNKGLDYAGNELKKFFGSTEREMRLLADDVRNLSGALERKIIAESEVLKKQLAEKSKLYEDLGISLNKGEIELEKTRKEITDLEGRYDIIEKLKEGKDRFDKRLLTLDKKLEDLQPGALKNINDRIRRLFGKPSGEEGKSYRQAVYERLDTLGKLYDNRRDIRQAEGEVLSKINEYLAKTPNLDQEERKLFEFLQEQYKAQLKNPEDYRSEELRNFIKNYKTYEPRTDLYLKVRDITIQAEKNKELLERDSKYLRDLHDNFKKSDKSIHELRQKSALEYKAVEEEVNKNINSLRSTINSTLDELKKQGYNIETKEDYASKGKMTKTISPYIDGVRDYGSAVIGGLVGLFTLYSKRRNKIARTTKGALTDAVGKYNQLAEKHNELLNQDGRLRNLNSLLAQEYNNILRENESISLDNTSLNQELENYKNPESLEYNNGEGI